jgi:hypothetical protein
MVTDLDLFFAFLFASQHLRAGDVLRVMGSGSPATRSPLELAFHAEILGTVQGIQRLQPGSRSVLPRILRKHWCDRWTNCSIFATDNFKGSRELVVISRKLTTRVGEIQIPDIGTATSLTKSLKPCTDFSKRQASCRMASTRTRTPFDFS